MSFFASRSDPDIKGILSKVSHMKRADVHIGDGAVLTCSGVDCGSITSPFDQ